MRVGEGDISTMTRGGFDDKGVGLRESCNRWNLKVLIVRPCVESQANRPIDTTTCQLIDSFFQRMVVRTSRRANGEVPVYPCL